MMRKNGRRSIATMPGSAIACSKSSPRRAPRPGTPDNPPFAPGAGASIVPAEYSGDATDQQSAGGPGAEPPRSQAPDAQRGVARTYGRTGVRLRPGEPGRGPPGGGLRLSALLPAQQIGRAHV